MKVNEEYVLHSENGKDYRFKIASVNDYRPPEYKYAIDVYDEDGNHVNIDFIFVGEDFFKNNNIELVKE